jgi:DNA repair exonuclease SbcCD nuclease subunit
MTKLKILCIGDPHIKIDNLAEFKEFEIKLIELIEKENPNFIVCLGDILHTHERLHTIPLNKAYSFIDNIRKFCPLYLIVGNHDYIHNQEFLSENHWMNSLKEWKNVFVIDKVKELKIDKRNFVFVPYVFPGKFGEALSTINNNIWKKSDIIFAHQEIKGCKMGPIQSTEGDEWNLEYPQIISGHIHSNQKPQKNVYYPGSALQNAFGESEKNIIPIIEYEEKGEFFLREIDLLLPRKKIISCDIKNIDQIKINENTKDKLRITLKGDYDDFKSLKKTSKYKELVEKGIKIVFRNNVEKTPIENKEHNKHEEKNIVEKSFSEILRELILKEENKKLYCLYEKIINNNEILVL